MRVDPASSQYHEHPDVWTEFSKPERRRLRILLRRLRFLEAKVDTNGGIGAATGAGAEAFAEWEMEALEWALLELGFLDESRLRDTDLEPTLVSGNPRRKA